MSISGIVGTWVGIFPFIAIVLGGLEHAARTDPSANQARPRPMAEDRIFQLATAALGVVAIAVMGWVALSD
jgi:hypothetical protein